MSVPSLRDFFPGKAILSLPLRWGMTLGISIFVLGLTIAIFSSDIAANLNLANYAFCAILVVGVITAITGFYMIIRLTDNPESPFDSPYHD